MNSIVYIKKNIFNILSVIVIFVMTWEPLRVFYFHVDAAGRFTLFAELIALLLLYKHIPRILFKGALFIYTLLAIYIFVNGLLKGSLLIFLAPLVLFNNIFSVLMLSFIVICMSKSNFDRTLKILITALYIYTIVCGINDSSADSERLGTEINANTIALNAAFCILSIVLLFLRKNISLIKTVLLSIYPFFVMLQTSSRTAFLIVVMAVIMNYVVNTKMDVASLLKLILFSVSIIILGIYVAENTAIGERIMSITSQAEEVGLETGTVLDLLGDRGYQYYVSWAYFLDNFITGIGLRMWVVLSPTGHVFHSEYLVQYCENGIIGITLFLFFYKKMYGGLNRSLKTNDTITIKFMIILLFSLMVINVFYWSFNQMCVFAMYGIIIGSSMSTKNSETV